MDAFTTFWVTLALYLAVRAMDGAGVRRGPVPLVYLAVWAVGAGWEAGAQDYPILGLAALGICAALAIGVTVVARSSLQARGRTWGDILVASSGVLASVAYLAIWTVLIVAAPREFALADGLIALGFASLIFGLAVLVTFIAAGVVRRQSLGLPGGWNQSLAVGSVGIMWMALVVGLLVGGLSSLPTLFVAVAAIALLILDVTELTDYALFGVALGAAVASRVNVAPLAALIVVAAAIRALPALDSALPRIQRNRLIAYALTGVMAAAVLSFVAFRLLQPHAFLGPGVLGLQFNPGWRDDVSEAAHLTSGNWDAPPNHQWASRTPYLFPWRNIVLWGLGVRLGVVLAGAGCAPAARTIACCRCQCWLHLAAKALGLCANWSRLMSCRRPGAGWSMAWVGVLGLLMMSSCTQFQMPFSAPLALATSVVISLIRIRPTRASTACCFSSM